MSDETFVRDWSFRDCVMDLTLTQAYESEEEIIKFIMDSLREKMIQKNGSLRNLSWEITLRGQEWA